MRIVLSGWEEARNDHEDANAIWMNKGMSIDNTRDASSSLFASLHSDRREVDKKETERRKARRPTATGLNPFRS